MWHRTPVNNQDANCTGSYIFDLDLINTQTNLVEYRKDIYQQAQLNREGDEYRYSITEGLKWNPAEPHIRGLGKNRQTLTQGHKLGGQAKIHPPTTAPAV